MLEHSRNACTKSAGTVEMHANNAGTQINISLKTSWVVMMHSFLQPPKLVLVWRQALASICTGSERIRRDSTPDDGIAYAYLGLQRPNIHEGCRIRQATSLWLYSSDMCILSMGFGIEVTSLSQSSQRTTPNTPEVIEF